MKLTELDPTFLIIIDEGLYRMTRSLKVSDGVQFLCPLCFKTNAGKVGTHGVICWRPHVPPEVKPGPGRWEFLGTGFKDLTLVAKSSSILLTSGCRAHFFVEGGGIRMS